MPAFFPRKRYCHTCKKAYDHVTEHICPDSCKLCYFPNCPIVSWLPCINCNRVFKSQECFDRHKQNIGQGKSICALLVKCCHCNCVVKRGKLRPDLHHCGQTKCSTCNQYANTKYHQCYMQPVKKRSTIENEDVSLLDDEANDVEEDVAEGGYNELFFFDFECRQENCTHEPNLCVIQNEGSDEWVFQGDNRRNEFCEWLFAKEHANCIVVAHNFQGYDGYFIQQYLHENGIVPEVIMRGAKILTLSVPMLKIKFIDSLSSYRLGWLTFQKPLASMNWQKVTFPTCSTKRRTRTMLNPYHRVPITTRPESVKRKKKNFWNGITA